MKKLITSSGVYGPYNDVQVLADRFVVDGAEMPFTVVGTMGSVEPWSGPLPTPPVPPAPQEVEMRQARLALIEMGLDDEVESFLGGIPGVEGKKARAEWATARTVRRSHEVVLAAIELGVLTEEQADDLFRMAVSL